MKTGAQRGKSEEGYILVAVIFMLAIFALMMTMAAPEIGKQIQLDREHETMERGKQYVRAIQLYYRKFHAYPPTIKALMQTDNIRFLRQKYTDPMTGKDDWRIIHFGQAKTQTLGFFGKPLAGATGGSAGGTVMAGTGPSGGNANTSNGIFGGGGGMAGGMGGGIGSSSGGGSLGGGSSIFGTGNSGGTAGANGPSGSPGSSGGT
ncbi:MAG: type II secretion system protein, partial [Terracidiphilus sp.]